MAREELRADEKPRKDPHELSMLTAEQCRHAMHNPLAAKTTLVITTRDCEKRCPL